jgi:hypothetical protein
VLSPLEALSVELGLTDGSTRVVDLRPLLRGPVLEEIRDDPALFRQVRVDARLGTIVWPNGADIDPDVLALGLEPA